MTVLTKGATGFVRHDLMSRHLQRHYVIKGKAPQRAVAPPPPKAIPSSAFMNHDQQPPPTASPYFQSSVARSPIPEPDIPIASTSTAPPFLAPELSHPLSMGGWSPDNLDAGLLSVFDLAGNSQSYEWLFNLPTPAEATPDPVQSDWAGLDWAGLAAEGLAAIERPQDLGELLTEATSDKLQPIIASLIHEDFHPLATHSSLQRLLSLFFQRFDSLNPLIHRATFDPALFEPYLLLAMIGIGAYYSTHEDCALWQRLMPGLAGRVVVDEGFGPDASVQLLLTCLMVEIHGKLMNTLSEHSMRAILHPAFINLALRCLIFEPRSTPADDPDNPDSVWRAAVLDETAKRCAFTYFMIDSEHSTIFGHTRALSAFQVRLNLPWDEAEWTSPSAQAWQELRSQTSYVPPPSFATTMKNSLSPMGGHPPSSSLASCIIIYGLISVLGDLRAKDKVVMGVEGFAAESRWISVIGRALGSWKARLEAACLNRFAQNQLWSGLAVQAIAQISLFTDLVDIQILAGLRRVLGKRVGKVAYEHARQNLIAWAKSEQGAEAVWHAVTFLRTYLLHRIDSGERGTELADIPHLPYCLYLATTVCWSYGALHLPVLPSAEHFAAEGPPLGVESVVNQEHYLADALAYLESMAAWSPTELATRDVGTKSNTNGLIVYLIRETQNDKWESGREIMARGRFLINLP
ncbi:hypothetical protein RQP46_004541 [Phenoliferia psychrophenolica]